MPVPDRGDPPAVPIHGLRHPPEDGTTGWYIWTGEFSEAHDFFRPWHIGHLKSGYPLIVEHLERPPGSRFLVAPGYVDVWQDDALLD